MEKFEDPILIVLPLSNVGMNLVSVMLGSNTSFSGLQDRLQHAQVSGMVDPATGLPVANVVQMKAAIVNYLSSPPNAATNIGSHDLIFQFMPNWWRDQKLDDLLDLWPWLKHLGGPGSAPNLPPQAATWTDIVPYCQAITISRANAAVGPVDLHQFFNR